MTQRAEILRHLDSGQPITQGDALKLYGIARLAARIHELRDQGIEITKRIKRVRTRRGVARVAEYLRG